jgi:hypothetical protein
MMPFEINPASGNIDVNPLVSWESAVVADAGCMLRLVFATRKDVPESDPIVVQTAMSEQQAESLVQDLQKMLDHIRKARAAAVIH